MKRLLRMVPPALLGGLLFLVPGPARAAVIRDDYPSSSEVEDLIRDAAGDIPGASVVEYGRSYEGRPLLVLRIAASSGNPDERPGVLVVAGVEPTRLYAAEAAIEMARVAATAASGSRNPLERSVLYVIPDMNPDGRERVLGGATDDRNVRITDDDNDGAMDEDGPDDLDGDHAIRWLRIHRVGGSHRPDTSDVRASIATDATTGDAGLFDLVVEGRDNDRDGAINEDPAGGVFLNANFPYGYRMFVDGAGLHAVSEPETKALVDFVLSHPNIGTALVLASDDVLTEAPKAAEEGPAPSGGGFSFPILGGLPVDPDMQKLLSDRSPVKGILKADLPPYERAAKRYAAVVGVKKDAGAAGSGGGSLADWLRYHQGIFTLSAPGWNWSAADTGSAKADSAAAPDGGGGNGGDKSANGANATAKGKRGGGSGAGKGGAEKPSEARALKAAEKAGLDVFAPWKTITHPDYPNRTVEVGGLDPLFYRTPGHAEVDSIGARHGRFLRELLGWTAEVTIEEPVVERLSSGVYRIRTETANVGYLPTAFHQGVRSRKARPVRLDLQVPDGGVILSGQKVTLIHTLPGNGGHRELQWVVQAPAGSRVTLRAGAPRAGIVTREVTLP